MIVIQKVAYSKEPGLEIVHRGMEHSQRRMASFTLVFLLIIYLRVNIEWMSYDHLPDLVIWRLVSKVAARRNCCEAPGKHGQT